MNTKAVELYIGFWVGLVLTALFFTFLIVYRYTSNHFLEQNNIYLNGRYYKMCERQCR
jgi:hypothetical protein